MVTTRNDNLDVVVDEGVRQWCEKHDVIVTDLVNDANRLKGGEKRSRFSRMSKLEFRKVYGDDVALAWHFQFIKIHGENVTWVVYEEAILKRFDSINEDPMAELKNLRSNVHFENKRSGGRRVREVFGRGYDETKMFEYVLTKEVPQFIPHISLNAVSGVPTHNTMRVKGHALKNCSTY
ncbi:hypothetical protein Tco_0109604 [Tanacetum coccineum]